VIKRHGAGNGRQDGIVVDEEADIDAAVGRDGAGGVSGIKDRFGVLARDWFPKKFTTHSFSKLSQKENHGRPDDDPGNYMGPVISQSAMKRF